MVGPIGEESCPLIHRDPDVAHTGGGSLRHAAGDLLDASVSPGPFDAVIERRVLQLLSPADQVVGLRALETRMAPRRLLVSHQHSGGWRPGEDREHYAEWWVRERGYARRGVSKEADEAAERLAHLCYFSG